MNRAAVIEQLKQTPDMLAKLLAPLDADKAAKFAAYLTNADDNTGALASDATRATRQSNPTFSVD